MFSNGGAEKNSQESPEAVNPKGNQSWIVIGRTEAEAPILWPLDAKSQLIGKRPWFWKRLREGEEAPEGDLQAEVGPKPKWNTKEWMIKEEEGD